MNDRWLRLALRLARRGQGSTSPNPMVGAVLVKRGRILGRGWHRKAGLPHAEIEALNDARLRGEDVRGSTLFVTLEPCSTFGRTPPCTQAIIQAGIKRLVAAAIDPNPLHSGRGFDALRSAGVQVEHGQLAAAATDLNKFFNHWIIHRSPYVTVKAAMTLDGKIATAAGDSKWVTGEKARAFGMQLRGQYDAILVGIETILADDPSLTFRPSTQRDLTHSLRRIILDSSARTPLKSKVATDASRGLTTIIVGPEVPTFRMKALARRVRVVTAPLREGRIDLDWVLKHLGAEHTTSLLVEGGGEVNASFLLGGFAQEIAFFYAPKILGGRNARKAVSGAGALGWDDAVRLKDLTWRRLNPDLLLQAKIKQRPKD